MAHLAVLCQRAEGAVLGGVARRSDGALYSIVLLEQHVKLIRKAVSACRTHGACAPGLQCRVDHNA